MRSSERRNIVRQPAHLLVLFQLMHELATFHAIVGLNTWSIWSSTKQLLFAVFSKFNVRALAVFENETAIVWCRALWHDFSTQSFPAFCARAIALFTFFVCPAVFQTVCPTQWKLDECWLVLGSHIPELSLAVRLATLVESDRLPLYQCFLHLYFCTLWK